MGARFLGTTADRVIRTAEVLVVRGPLALPVRRVGVPTDFSPPSDGALDVALALAERLGGAGGEGPEIRAFDVGWTVQRQDGPALYDQTLVPRLARQAEAAVARTAGGPFRVQTEVVRGVDPADSIADHARREEIELLVMGTHGQGGLRRLLVGSVASGVARQAHCPVLLVPPASGEGAWRGSYAGGTAADVPLPRRSPRSSTRRSRWSLRRPTKAPPHPREGGFGAVSSRLPGCAYAA